MDRHAAAPPVIPNLAEIQERLGSIPIERIRLRPEPGTATEEDVIACHDREGRLCELVDGVLVEKAVGFYQGRLAAVLIHFFEDYLEGNDLGIVVDSDGMMKLGPGLVRMPDVSFLSWDRFPGRKLPRKPVPFLAPDLAVEILSESNTPGEMARKLREYFAAGARLAWIVDPETRTVKVYLSPESFTLVTEDKALGGGAILPGFTLQVKKWFTRAGEQADR